MPPSLRTDININQLPATLPNPGGRLGKNTIMIDPDFGTRIMRLTDASDATNHSMQTADSSGALIWNANDTLIFARSQGGTASLFQFDPVALQGTRLSFSTQGTPCFSATQPGVFYVITGSVVTQNTFTLVGGVWTFSSSSTVCDFANILPVGFNIKSGTEFLVSIDDTTFSAGFSEGPQNSGILCCVYQTGHGGAGLGFRMVNLNTGQITGDWGPTGAINLTSTNVAFPITFHEMVQTANPSFATIGPHGIGLDGKKIDTTLIWQIPTLNIIDQEATAHKAKGYLHTYPGAGGGQLHEVPYLSPVKPYRSIVQAANLPHGFSGDRHFAFGKISLTDASIVWTDTGYNTPQPFTSAWEGEVFGYDVVSGIVYRACHTFNSNKSPTFIVGGAICVPSQTGNFVAFTSDWGGVGTVGPLGSTSGAPTGTIGGDARGDVFIVQIPFGNLAPSITSANNATFTQGQAGSFIVNATGVPTPSISESGSLPSGVTFVDNGNGIATLSGTPAASGTFPLVITAANGISPNATQNFTLTVNIVTQIASAFTSANNATFTAAVLGSFSVTTTGTPTPTIVESGTMPSGVTFVDNGNGTGTLSGIAPSPGVYKFKFTASNGVPTDKVQNFTLTVTTIIPPGGVTGTFQFPNGLPVSNGKFQWKLNFDAVAPANAVVPTLISGKLNPTGTMNTTLIFNDQMQTAIGYNTTYNLTVNAFNGKQVWNENYFLTGTAANLNLIGPVGGNVPLGPNGPNG